MKIFCHHFASQQTELYHLLSKITGQLTGKNTSTQLLWVSLTDAEPEDAGVQHEQRVAGAEGTEHGGDAAHHQRAVVDHQAVRPRPKTYDCSGTQSLFSICSEGKRLRSR